MLAPVTHILLPLAKQQQQQTRHFVANVKVFKEAPSAKRAPLPVAATATPWQAHQFNARHLTLKCHDTHTERERHVCVCVCSTCERNFFRQLQPSVMENRAGMEGKGGRPGEMKEMLEEVKRSHMHVRKNGATENYCQCNKSHAHTQRHETTPTHSHTYTHCTVHPYLQRQH